MRSALACGIVVVSMLAPGEAGQPGPTTPLYENLGHHHRTVTTSSQLAQRYFDQGLIFVFAFNHDEAIRSFAEAARLDPSCAMAWWGQALANGPHINNPGMDPDHSKAAWTALTAARGAAGATSTEKVLIEALSARYADPPPEDRTPLDRAYADAMRKVWQAHPNDADIAVLFAEAMMDTRPWDLWTPEGKPQPGTEEILAALEAAMKLVPQHPGANHLYIHAVESSPAPERGVEAADRLAALVPAAGHLVHMPAHIYSRIGRWQGAAEANQRAIEADRVYRAQSPRQGFYNVYMAHNRHFLSWAAMMQGRSALAIQSARDMVAAIPVDFVRENAFAADGYMTIVLEALMRFGRWEEILAEPKPAEYLPITTAHWYFARAVSYAATNRVADAKVEQAAFLDAASKVTDQMIVGNNAAPHVLSIDRNYLDGELAYREGRIGDAVRSLREAARLEDGLRYNEAPDWIQPVRHTLGGVLLGAGRVEEAEAVYREDLGRNRENGWALYGLARCLRARKADAEAAEVEARFKKAWALADVPLEVTCFCLRGAQAGEVAPR